MSAYRESQEPLRIKRYRGVYVKASNLSTPERGDVVTIVSGGTMIYDGATWRRLKMTDEPPEPEPEDPKEAALRRLRTPLRLGTSHGGWHSEKTLAAIPNPERGDYATGIGGLVWVYDGVTWRRRRKKPEPTIE